MHAFSSYDFQDIVCQKLRVSVQAVLSYRQLLADIFLETHGTLRNAGKWPCGKGVGCNLNNAPNL